MKNLIILLFLFSVTIKVSGDSNGFVVNIKNSHKEIKLWIDKSNFMKDCVYQICISSSQRNLNTKNYDIGNYFIKRRKDIVRISDLSIRGANNVVYSKYYVYKNGSIIEESPSRMIIVNSRSEKAYVTPLNLRCELILSENKSFVNDSRPEFSWSIKSNTNDIYQTKYSIEVSKSVVFCPEDIVWDSGLIISNNTLNVEYDGKELDDSTRYYWRVTTECNNKLKGTSKVAFFDTGNLNDNYSTSYSLLKQDTISPIKRKSIEDSISFFDFGKASFGTLLVKVKSDKNYSRLNIYFGESEDNGRVNRTPRGFVRFRKQILELKKGTHTYRVKIEQDSYNTRKGAILMPDYIGEVLPFRYCEFVSESRDVKVIGTKQISVFYPFDNEKSFFSSNDERLNKIWDLCKYSIKATSFCGIYVDGDRERIPYEADAYINQLSHYYVDSEYSIGRLSHEYLLEKPTWPTEWILHSVLMAYEDYLATANIESLKNYYSLLKNKTLISLSREDGLISTKTGLLTNEVINSVKAIQPLRDIVDWPDGSDEVKDTINNTLNIIGERDNYDMVNINTVVNSFYYRTLIIMSKFAQVLDKQDDYKKYITLAKKVKESINLKLYDKHKRVYIDGEGSSHSSLHANFFPLAFGIVEEDNVKHVIDFIKTRGMRCSVYGAQYLLSALYDYNEDNYAFSLITSDSNRGWLNMIKMGSTITTEAWDVVYKNNMDWNHAWGAAPANLLPGSILGVKPLKPGWSEFEINPKLSDLKFVDAKIPTISGEVYLSIDKLNDKKRIAVNIPSNTTGFLNCQRFLNSKISINGKLVRKSEYSNSYIKLSSGSHKIIIND